MRWIFHAIVGSIIALAVWHFVPEILSSSPHTHPSGASAQVQSSPSTDVHRATSILASTVRHFHRLLPGGAPPPAEYNGGIFYSPGTNLEKIDISEIEHTTTGHLDIAMYAFTDVYIARAVVDVADRGVKVRIYTDNEQWHQELRQDRYVISLLESSPNIHIRVKGTRTLMHLKAYCNGDVLREGSANWSPGGEMRQDNTLSLTSNPAAIAQFEKDFNHIWNRPSNIIIK